MDTENKAVLRAYWRITGIRHSSIEQLPVEACRYLQSIVPTELIAYDVRQDYEKYQSLRLVARKYHVGVRVIRRLVKNVSEVTHK